MMPRRYYPHILVGNENIRLNIHHDFYEMVLKVDQGQTIYSFRYFPVDLKMAQSKLYKGKEICYIDMECVMDTAHG